VEVSDVPNVALVDELCLQLAKANVEAATSISHRFF